MYLLQNNLELDGTGSNSFLDLHKQVAMSAIAYKSVTV